MKILAFLAAVFLAACAAVPSTEQPELARARTVVNALAADSQAASLAPAEVGAARAQLGEAERLARENADRDEVVHRAYLAEQRARIARELAQARANEAEIARAGEERDRVLMASRAEEKYRANEAEAALARAKAAQESQAVANQALAGEVRRLQEQVRELEARQTQRGWVITLGSDLLFDVGRATLKPGGRRALDNLARIMRNEPERTIVIEGFTDDRGPVGANRRLSERRAQAVRHALVQHGVAASRIEARGLGEAYPVASNANPAGRQLNRRVEILIGEHIGRAATGATAPPSR